MARSKIPPEEPTWNQVKTLFESLRKEISMLAEEVRSMRKELSGLKTAIASLTEEVALLRPAVRSLDQRVSALEAKGAL